MPTIASLLLLPSAPKISCLVQLLELLSPCWMGYCPIHKSLDKANKIFTIHSIELCSLTIAYKIWFWSYRPLLKSFNYSLLFSGWNSNSFFFCPTFLKIIVKIIKKCNLTCSFNKILRAQYNIGNYRHGVVH